MFDFEQVTTADLLYVVLTVVVPLLLRYVYQIVSAKIEGTNYEDAVTSVMNAVNYVNQTFVDSLKESGSFDKEAQQIAFEKAKTAALDTMKAGTRKWLDKSFDSVDEWLTVQIETAVKTAKGGVY